MALPRTRPRFSLHRPEGADAMVARVGAYLAAHPHPVTSRVFRRTIMMTLAADRRHFWTPHLEVQFSDAADGGTDVDGTFAPHPRLWTTFVATQLLFGTLALGLAIYVFSLWSLGQGLVVPAVLLGVALVGGGLSFGTAYVGQGLGSAQMYELRSSLDAALRGEADVASP